ncbi:MAG: class I SAM-dependent methyltransferase [Chitinophagaceae bacterium]|nr:MAG: class I SAM-dependent methyltransferase [Chitinophagaceae bacterium]
MNKSILSNLLRKTGLLHLADKTKFFLEKVKNKKINNQFKEEHPHIKLPPDYLIYESFQMNYRKYYTGGKATANWLTEIIRKHTDLEEKTILDWGCGPGRIIRHLPQLTKNCKLYGTDYNQKTIDWCKRNLGGIHFNLNSLEAKLPYSDEQFDIVYGISIFTHLSEKMHNEWFDELYRTTKKGGIMLFTLQGDNFKGKLSGAELEQYENNKLVIRGGVKEGHRIFSAFHPKEYVKNLFKKAEILEHIEPKPINRLDTPQDIWIIRKTA